MTTHSLQPIVAEQAVFRDLSQQHLDLLTGCAANVRFNEGQTVFEEGASADKFFLIRSGRIAIQLNTPARGPLLLQTLGPGDLVGWSWLVPPHTWRYDAVALETTLALSFDGRCLRAKCAEDHELGYQFFQRFARVMVERLEATRLQLLDIYQPGR